MKYKRNFFLLTGVFVLLFSSLIYAQPISARFVTLPTGVLAPSSYALSQAAIATANAAITTIGTGAGAAGGTTAGATTAAVTATTGGSAAAGGLFAFLQTNPIGWAIDAVIVIGVIGGGYALWDAYSDSPPPLMVSVNQWNDSGHTIEVRQRIQLDCDDADHPEAGEITVFNDLPIPWLGGYNILSYRCSDFDRSTGFLGFGGGDWIEMEAYGPLIEACKAPQALRKIRLMHGGSPTGSRTIDIPGCVKAEFGPTDPETWVSGDQEAGIESGNGMPAVRITVYPQVAQNLKNSVMAGFNYATTAPVDPATVPQVQTPDNLTKGNTYIRLGDQDYEIAKESTNTRGKEGEVYKELATIVRIKNANGQFLNTLAQYTKGDDERYYLRFNAIEPGQYTLEFNFPKGGTKSLAIVITKEDLNLR